MGMPQSLVVVGSPAGTLRALSSQDGSLLWQQEIGYPLRGPVLAIQEDTIYTASPDGHVQARSLADGALRWRQIVPGSHYGQPWPGVVRLAAAHQHCFSLPQRGGYQGREGLSRVARSRRRLL